MYATRACNLLGALAVAVGDHIRVVPDDAGDRAVSPAALVHLSHCARPTVDSLRKAVGLSHPAAVRLADRLARQGLVARTPDPADRRAVLLCLTEAGRQRARSILQRRGVALDAVMAVLDAEDKARFEALAARLLAGLAGKGGDLYRTCRLCETEACKHCPVEAARRP